MRTQREVLLEQQRVKARMRRSPENAAMIDIDAYQENPVEVDPRDFVETSHTQILTRLQKAVEVTK